MSTVFMSQLPRTLRLMEGEQDQGLFPASTFHVAKDPPILFPFMITSPVHVDQLQGQSSYGDQHLGQHALSESTQQFTDRTMISGSEVFPRRPSPFGQTIQSIDGDMIQRSESGYDPYDIVENQRTEGLSGGGWTVSSSSSTPPAKMKIMRKATSEYPPEGGAARKPRRRAQAHQDESQLLTMQQQQAMGVVVRVCSDCNTTKTPLWRSGPRGPKSLCNACGIRQRKARRAMAAAAAAAAAASNGGAPPQAVSGVATQQQPKPARKEKRSDAADRSLPFKKRCKMVVVVDHAAGAAAATATPEAAAARSTKDQADHVSGDKQVVAPAAAMRSLDQSEIATPPPSAVSSFHAAFPADEITDAAMLLMTLSCGLVVRS